MIPRYLALHRSGELHERAAILKNYYAECCLCPHQCRKNRRQGERGICRSGNQPVVASYTSHMGEEPPISGYSGSGTIFFSGCTGRCLFCQNYPISQLGTGHEVSESRLAEMMVELQEQGCHNINFVTPTHFIPSIVSALSKAIPRGFSIPLVYNTSGYERVEIIKLLDGIIDIYLPDAKYANDEIAYTVSGFRNYVHHNRSALKEMFRQVGILKVVDSLAVQGLIVRHLILPENMSGTDDVMKYLSHEISPDIAISLMDQYFPAYHAVHHNILNRRITNNEYQSAIEYFHHYELNNGWVQEHVDV